MCEKTKAQQQALADELRAKADVRADAMRERARRDIESASVRPIAEVLRLVAARRRRPSQARSCTREVHPATSSGSLTRRRSAAQAVAAKGLHALTDAQPTPWPRSTPAA
jgi:hypothetical protein